MNIYDSIDIHIGDQGLSKQRQPALRDRPGFQVGVGLDFQHAVTTHVSKAQNSCWLILVVVL
jgi:hypothetical protein